MRAFHQAIPDIGHRCQVIHHAVATGVFLSLYVVASCGEKGIIRMVLLKLHEGFHGYYIAPIMDIFNHTFPGLLDPQIDVPEY